MTWQASTEIDQLSAALVKTLGTLTDVPRGRQAKIETRGGGSYGYRYADLGDALTMIRPALATNGLAVTQSAVSTDSDTIGIYTTIHHTSGQWITFGPLSMPAGRTAQETGSAITYGRRYALLAALGLATEDDDGASASRRPRQAPRQTSTSPAQDREAPAPRSKAESEIRQLIEGLTTEQATHLRSTFRDRFGALVALPIERHDEALAWVTEMIGVLNGGGQ